MATTNVSIASDSTHLDINAAIATMLARHGEDAVMASVAQAIGFGRMIQIAGQGASTFSHAAFSAATANVMTYYDAGCPGAKTLARTLGLSIFKKGFTCVPVAEDRLDGLDEVIYGGWAANQTRLDATQPLPGWADWQFARYEAADTAHLILPQGVVITSKGLWRVYLPPHVDPVSFDRIVTAKMMPRQLAYWAMSGEGRAHCHQRGLDPQEFVRFARDGRTGILRPVEELYRYAPRRDAAWFAAILGEALAHVRRGAIAH